MSGWSDWIFGNLPRSPPAHPASRGALLGAVYQGMPDATTVEDARVNHNIFPSGTRPHDRNAGSRNSVNPFGQYYGVDQYDYLQKHLPGGQLQMPEGQLQDPDAAPDPSVTANIKLAQDRQYDARQGAFIPTDWTRDDRQPQSFPPRRGPNIAGPLSSDLWGGS